jgi:hypothetical protein
MDMDFMPSFSKKTFFSRKLGDVGEDEGEGVEDDEVIEGIGPEWEPDATAAGSVWSNCRKCEGFGCAHFSPSGHTGFASGTCLRCAHGV